MDLIRDLLDKEVLDRNGRGMGRVDSVIIEVASGAPPRVVAIELGAAILFQRIHPILGRWMGALEHAFGMGDGEPLRVPAGSILGIEDHVKVDLP
jgi:sporulation protein YlmC with PRC-barrel domain